MVVAIAIAAVAVVAGSLGGYFYLHRSSGSGGSVVVDDGPTLYQAVATLNDSVSIVSGGPWTLFTVYGVATPVPFAPAALSWGLNSEVVNSCQAQLGGLTIWNGSIPLFDGAYSSGTAPFWQMMYFSNASQSIVVATDVQGQPHVYPPMAMNSTCASDSGLSYQPWDWAKEFSPLPADSPIMATAAWTSIGQSWQADYAPAAELYRFGSGVWGGGAQGLVVQFERCGLIGDAGPQPLAEALLWYNGTVVSAFEGSVGCGNVYRAGPPPVYYPYHLNLTETRGSFSGGASDTYLTIHASAGDAATGTIPDPAGIVSWMVGLNLTSASGVSMERAKPGCSGWVVNITSCPADPSGWYVVLLSGDSSWLDGYGASTSGSNWSVPNVSIVSNQQLVIVCPASWTVAGDILTASSTTVDAPLSGSVTL